MNLNNYRIKRTDSRNITIQRRKGKRWVVISYHGNSLNSLISGLLELIVAQHTPEAENMREALLDAKLELIRGLDSIKGMVDEATYSK